MQLAQLMNPVLFGSMEADLPFVFSVDLHLAFSGLRYTCFLLELASHKYSELRTLCPHFVPKEHPKSNLSCDFGKEGDLLGNFQQHNNVRRRWPSRDTPSLSGR